jgi:hypothetical protein
MLPSGRKLITLSDAALCQAAAEHDAKEWQAVMLAPLLVAEHDGPTDFARMGVMRALHRQSRKPAPSQRRMRPKAYRIVRGQ